MSLQGIFTFFNEAQQQSLGRAWQLRIKINRFTSRRVVLANRFAQRSRSKKKKDSTPWRTVHQLKKKKLCSVGKSSRSRDSSDNSWKQHSAKHNDLDRVQEESEAVYRVIKQQQRAGNGKEHSRSMEFTSYSVATLHKKKQTCTIHLHSYSLTHWKIKDFLQHTHTSPLIPNITHGRCQNFCAIEYNVKSVFLTAKRCPTAITFTLTASTSSKEDSPAEIHTHSQLTFSTRFHTKPRLQSPRTPSTSPPNHAPRPEHSVTQNS